MRGSPGSPGFKGQRLREAREALGLTMVSLADMLGVNRATITLYENGGRTPSPEVLDKIVRCLGMPHEFYFRQPLGDDLGTVFYRSLSAATKTARRKAEQRFGWLYELVSGIEQLVELPAVDLPDLNLKKEPYSITEQDIEDAASATRKYWGIDDGPVPDLIDHVESHGIVVGQFVMESDDLDAFSCWPDHSKRPFILLNADKSSAARLRLDVAHELGHQVLHPHLDQTATRKPEVHRLVERQAFRFASAFLMEAGLFLDDIDALSLDYLRTLKQTWGVSIGAMLFRLKDLGVLDTDESQRLWRTYAMRGYRREEPFDDSMEAERPTMLSKAVDLIGGPGRLLLSLRNRIVLPPQLCEQLLCLPIGATETEPPVPHLRLRPNSGQVVDFPSKNEDAD